CAQFDKALKVGVQPAPADLIAARLGDVPLAKTGQERSHQHDGAPKGPAVLLELGGLKIVQVYVSGLEGIASPPQLADLYPKVLEQVYQFVDIDDVRNVVDRDLFLAQEHGADDLQCLVLCSLGGDLSLQLMAPFYAKCTHGSLGVLGSFLSAPGPFFYATVIAPCRLDRPACQELSGIG